MIKNRSGDLQVATPLKVAQPGDLSAYGGFIRLWRTARLGVGAQHAVPVMLVAECHPPASKVAARLGSSVSAPDKLAGKNG